MLIIRQIYKLNQISDDLLVNLEVIKNIKNYSAVFNEHEQMPNITS